MAGFEAWQSFTPTLAYATLQDIDADTHDVVVAELTPDDVGEVSTFTELLQHIDSRVATLTADGAYDGEAVYNAVAERHPGAAVIIPPRVTAVANEASTRQRNRHIAMIAQHGRIRLAASIGLQSKELG